MTTLRRARPSQTPRGMSVLLVLGILAMVLALTYGISHSSATSFTLATRQGAKNQAEAAAESAAVIALDNLDADPSWMPASTITGTLASGESYQLDVQPLSDSQGIVNGRRVTATAQVLDASTGRVLGQHRLVVTLTKQARDDLPISAIAAFAADISALDGPPVYLANGSLFPGTVATQVTEVRGNVRSRGPIQSQKPSAVEGTFFVMGQANNDGAVTAPYQTYKPSWETGTYQAAALASSGTLSATGQLKLINAQLAPSTSNPMGVFYHQGNVILDNNVNISGTLVVKGDVTITGTGVQLSAYRKPLGTAGTDFASFPAMVVDGSVTFYGTADWVRISGAVVASKNINRVATTTPIAQNQSPFHTPVRIVSSRHGRPGLDLWGPCSSPLWAATGAERIAPLEPLQAAADDRPLAHGELSLASRDPAILLSLLLAPAGNWTPPARLGNAARQVIAGQNKELREAIRELRQSINAFPVVDQADVKSEIEAIKHDIAEAQTLADVHALWARILAVWATLKKTKSSCGHDHSLGIDARPDPFGTADGPAIYIKGTVLANRVSLQSYPDRPFALVFDGSRADVSDAPGFFTWRVVDWNHSTQP